MKKVLYKMKQILQYAVQNVKAFVILGTIVISSIVFLATLAPRMNYCESEILIIKQNLAEVEHKHDLTITKLETTLLQISTDLQILKQHILIGKH